MCGLIVMLGEGPNRAAIMARGLNAMGHRGLPGRMDYWLGDNTALGHVRLPIRGLGPEYDQPFDEGDWVGIFAGEIFTTTQENDALFALKELQNKGPTFLHDHDGFWAMALHNKYSGVTAVITDHMSIKPLYYHVSVGIIASELKAIEAMTDNLTINKHFMSSVIKWGYDPSLRTPYNEVLRLKSGYAYLFMGKQGLTQGRYFEMKPKVVDLRTEIIRAVENRLVSDVPVATLCSGGLDSTIVSLIAARKTEGPMTVFHIDNGESEYFDLIDWPSNVTISKLELEPTSLEKAMQATEEPVDLGSVLPQYQLGKAVHDAGFKVVLSGDGADELFGGYRRAQEYDSQWSDVFSELIHYHLPRLDKTMMASTVELRSPFLAPNVIQGALALPYDQRTKKQMLKSLFSDIVPKGILDREKKPLKTQAVIQGGIEYRKMLVDMFMQRRK